MSNRSTYAVVVAVAVGAAALVSGCPTGGDSVVAGATAAGTGGSTSGALSATVSASSTGSGAGGDATSAGSTGGQASSSSASTGAGGAGGQATFVYKWVAAAPTLVAHAYHSATVLADGRVFVTGGIKNTDIQGHVAQMTDTEFYDPIKDSWTKTASLPLGSSGHASTLLSDGRVLISGGNTAALPVPAAWIYQPGIDSWTTTAPQNTCRSQSTATILGSGRVLVVGGECVGYPTNTAEVYDPILDTWTSTPLTNGHRVWHAATRLLDGRVLVAGGGLSAKERKTAELYDETLNTWTALADMNDSRYSPLAALLPDGRAMLIGGKAALFAEWLDPATLTWMPASAVQFDGVIGSAVAIGDVGRAISVAGCCAGAADVASGVAFDPATNNWLNVPPLPDGGRESHTASTLGGSRVLVVGGDVLPPPGPCNGCYFINAFKQAWILEPLP